jgi:hypothetical protein
MSSLETKLALGMLANSRLRNAFCLQRRGGAQKEGGYEIASDLFNRVNAIATKAR